MDRSIMEGDPHLLIEGIAIASYAIGATKAYHLYPFRIYPGHRPVEQAVRQASEYGLLGHHIFGSGFNLRISVRKGPGAFVCGEETAMIRSLEGKRGMPRSKPPYPATEGLHHKPTIINNVETLSNIPLIIGKGPKWFKEDRYRRQCGNQNICHLGESQGIPVLSKCPLAPACSDIVFDIARRYPRMIIH